MPRNLPDEAPNLVDDLEEVDLFEAVATAVLKEWLFRRGPDEDNLSAFGSTFKIRVVKSFEFVREVIA